MNIRKSIAKAASSVQQTLFKRLSTNPNTQNYGSQSFYDLLYQHDYKKVRHYRDWRKMMQDPQVKVGLSILQMFLLSREFNVTATGEEDLDKQAASFVEDEFKQNMDTPLRNVRKNIYTALPYGFSAQEMVYRLRDDGKVGLKGMYPIHRKTLDHADAFQYDDNGELTELWQSMTYGATAKIPIDKTLLFSYDCEFDDPHGNSTLDEIYEDVYRKKQTLESLAIYILKSGNPFLVGKLDSTNESHKKEMLHQLEQVFEGRTQMTVGKDDDVQVLESSHQGEVFFNKIQYHDNVIFRRMFIGTLIMGQGDASGSFAQSQTQVEVMRMLLDGVHEEIAGAIQKKADQLCDWNFRGASKPKIGFEKFEDKDIIGLMNALEPYFKDMIVDKGEWFNDVITEAVKEYANIDIDMNKASEPADTTLPQDDIQSIPGDENAPLNDILKSTLPPR